MPFDRARTFAFVRFIARRFYEDNCFATAAALAYTTLFALVPMLTSVLGVLTVFPVFDEWRERITGFMFENFVPTAGLVVQGYFTQFAASASQATAIGILVLLFSAVSLMLGIEDAFNRIWRVPASRSVALRLAMHWSVLMLAPVLLVASLALMSWVFAMPWLAQAGESLGLKGRLLGIAPFLIEFLGLCACYALIPNCRVRLRDATIGAGAAALLFEAAKRGFAAYIGSGSSYTQIYGALAIIPIFILWIYLSWLLVLFGASLAATLAAFEPLPRQPPAEIDDEPV